VDLELVRTFLLIDDLEEELGVIAVELSVVRLVINLFSRLSGFLLSAVEIASLSRFSVLITIAVIISFVTTVISVIEATLGLIIIVSFIIIIVPVVRASLVSLGPVVSVSVAFVIASLTSALAPVIVIIISTFSVVPGLVRVSFALFCLLRFLLGVLLDLRTAGFSDLSELEVVIILIVIFDLVPSNVGNSRYVFLLFTHFFYLIN
jgi:hypothetical protein